MTFVGIMFYQTSHECLASREHKKIQNRSNEWLQGHFPQSQQCSRCVVMQLQHPMLLSTLTCEYSGWDRKPASEKFDLKEAQVDSKHLKPMRKTVVKHANLYCHFHCLYVLSLSRCALTFVMIWSGCFQTLSKC